MAAVTICIGPDELRGLRALAELDGTPAGRRPDAAVMAAALMRRALAAELEKRGLPRPPSTEAAGAPAAGAAEPVSAAPSRRGRGRPGKWVTSVLAAAVLVVLWGGYLRGWRWTGFPANGQLWDWLSLLLLPVVVGILPAWIRHASDFSRAARVAGLAALAAFAVFAAAGYLVPLPWTGFRSQTLWDWFGLLLLPVALVIAPMLPKDIRSLRPCQKRAVVVAALAWAVTIIGGYALSWKWTGYQGNTLWDWLRLLLLPLVVPTVLMPALLRRLSGPSRPPALEAGAGGAPGRNGVIFDGERRCQVAATAPAGPAESAKRAGGRAGGCPASG